MKKTIILAAIVGAFVSINSYAELSEWTKISQYETRGLKRVALQFQDAIPNPVGCGGSTAQKFRGHADESLVAIDYLASASLAAFIAGKEVRVAVDENSCSPSSLVPRIKRIDIR